MNENKYKKWYDAIIQYRKENPISKDDEYCESHHIIPRSLGGSNDDDNLINLTAREHYIVHKLLTKFTEGDHRRKMHWALHRMIHSRNSEWKVNSKQYEHFRKSWSKFLSENHSSVTNSEWCQKVSESVKRSWENDEARREKTGQIASEYQRKLKEKDPEKYHNEMRRRAKIGAQKAKEVLLKDIEYYGIMYRGWSDLQEKTGVTKFLYNKFYKQGIDPTFRINKDGPMKADEIHLLLDMYCQRVDREKPRAKEELIEVLDRMIGIGLLSERQKKIFLEENK